MATVSLRGIRKQFGNQVVLSDLSLDIRSGEFVTLLGPSGCGKTTLLRMIAGLEPIDRGEVLIGDRVVNNVAPQHRPIAMVFQSYALFPHMTVRENVLFGLRIKRVPADTMEQKMRHALEMLQLDGLEERLPRQISGGQRQRVALARALVLDPDVLLLDEPLSNLDAALRETAMEELKRIHRQVHKTVIYVTHNQVEAMSMSDRIAVLDRGRLEQYDTPRAVYGAPRTLFAAGFVGSPTMNFYDGELDVRDGDAIVKSPLGFLQLDGSRSETAAAIGRRKVRIGVRPQSIIAAHTLSSRRSSDTVIAASVELVESLGDRSLVVARAADNTLVRFLVERDEDVSVDKPVELVVDGRRTHLFDPETGMNLFADSTGR